ncbi:MAG TPA: 23S rRNA (adenine(2503)-C(2))-methyltransferase RlmN, partial [Candidatus Moranbacteria bacterium]|nr:23S rRNA (adenine(2503)-C(2))-methyltransferase RlmN [Candidatus Moranbacteria bacterium]
FLEKEMKILFLEPVNILVSKNGDSIKALLKTSDDNFIETVLLSSSDLENEKRSWSACVSSQIGCAMGCRFCATGKMGFKRNLTAEEITDQILFWKQYLKKLKNNSISNIVYMGMGEPFLNWENVSESLKILTSKDLFGFGSRSLSVSTSGIAEGILKLAEEFPQVNLAISLHFPDDEKRSEFMPVNKKDNLEKIKEALQKYFQKTKRKVFVEYILLDGINDSEKDAEKLAKYLHSIGNAHLLHINLIRYNMTSADFLPSSRNKAYIFKEFLSKRKINSTIRKSLGEEIQGACGQLAGKK